MDDLQDPEFFLDLMQQHGRADVVSIRLGEPLKGGYSQITKKVHMTMQDGREITAMAKVNQNSCIALAVTKKLGTYREAAIYNIANSLRGKTGSWKMPESYLALHDESTGRTCVVMEFIEGAHNLMKVFGELEYRARPDLDRPIKLGDDVVTALQILKLAAKAIGHFHGYFWMDTKLREECAHLLFRQDWYTGKNRPLYEELMKMQRNFWSGAKMMVFPAAIGIPKRVANYDKLVAVMDAHYRKSTWENYQATIADPKFRWTWAHFDSHPGNWVWNPKTKDLVMIDLELVGLQQPVGDLVVFTVWRTEPNFRRKHERELVQIYYDALISHGKCDPTDYPFERCFEDYIFNGFSRLAFFVTNMSMAPARVGYETTLETVIAFMMDHGITPENVRPAEF